MGNGVGPQPGQVERTAERQMGFCDDEDEKEEKRRLRKK